jgi:exonuclease SbcD
MKISITSDIHLSLKHPERSKAFEDILKQTESAGISDLIIAGDLFDSDGDDSAYSSFLEPCRRHPGIRIHLLPGNHDSKKSLRDLQFDQLIKYTHTQIVDLDGISFLFIPYQSGKSMSDELDLISDKLWEKPLCVVGHGDFIDGQRVPNPREKGVYMPLKKGDLSSPNLLKVFLGHIHKPTPINQPLGGKVIYPGSPQGLDISETGPRRFLVYDTSQNEVSERIVNSEKIYLDEKFFVVPSNDQVARLLSDLNKRAADGKWVEFINRLEIRFTVEGFTSDKEELIQAFESQIKQMGVFLYRGSGNTLKPNPNFDALLSSTDKQLDLVAEKALEEIDALVAQGWAFGDINQPNLEEVKMSALRAIYQDH